MCGWQEKIRTSYLEQTGHSKEEFDLVFKDSILKLEVFYKDLHMSYITERPAYTVSGQDLSWLGRKEKIYNMYQDVLYMGMFLLFEMWSPKSVHELIIINLGIQTSDLPHAFGKLSD